MWGLGPGQEGGHPLRQAEESERAVGQTPGTRGQAQASTPIPNIATSPVQSLRY